MIVDVLDEFLVGHRGDAEHGLAHRTRADRFQCRVRLEQRNIKA